MHSNVFMRQLKRIQPNVLTSFCTCDDIIKHMCFTTNTTNAKNQLLAKVQKMMHANLFMHQLNKIQSNELTPFCTFV